MEFPKDFFDPPANRPKNWPDNPELRAAANWFKTFMSQREWEERRLAAAKRLYTAALGQLEDPSGKGSLFAVGDTFGWYLFLADAFLDHVWNYDPTYGSRVVPVFQAIGRHIPLLQGVRGLDARVQRLVGPEKRQPNGGLFELLVAGAYRRAGAEVEFPPEIPGGSKTHDMNVRLDGQTWAVECKRMEPESTASANAPGCGSFGVRAARGSCMLKRVLSATCISTSKSMKSRTGILHRRSNSGSHLPH